MGLPRGLSGKESACQCRRRKFKSWAQKSPERGNGDPLQYTCLENFTDGGVWWATVHGVTKSQTQLSTSTNSYISLYGCVTVLFKVLSHFSFL